MVHRLDTASHIQFSDTAESSILAASPAVTDRFGFLVSQLHTAVDLDSFWKASLQLLSESIPHHSCSLLYGIVDKQTLNARHHMPGARADRRSVSNLFIVQSFLARHPGVKLYTFGEVLSEDPTAEQRRLAQQSPDTDPWDDFVHLAFWDGDRTDAVLSVRRGPIQGPFLPEEVNWLRSLHPIIEAGLQRLRRLAEERSQHLSIERFLADVPVPVLFLDSHLRLIYASREGYAACAEWNFGERSARSLNPRRSFQLPDDIAEACRKIDPKAETDSDRACKLRVAHPTATHLMAQIVVDAPHASHWARPVYRILFLVDRSIDGVLLSANPASVALLQRLTSNERRVALLVTEGYNNRDIADRLGKSPRTVECQLTEIYRKLGVKNRVQLTRTLV
ncbi:MAG TPA: helix-turn-helix transcriptional regulator [Opitutaceae bacterium]